MCSRVVCCVVCVRRAVFVAVCVCCLCDVVVLFVFERCGVGLCLFLFAIVCVCLPFYVLRVRVMSVRLWLRSVIEVCDLCCYVVCVCHGVFVLLLLCLGCLC